MHTVHTALRTRGWLLCFVLLLIPLFYDKISSVLETTGAGERFWEETDVAFLVVIAFSGLQLLFFCAV